jgi:uncharacterized membrane protein YedE/YeeE
MESLFALTSFKFAALLAAYTAAAYGSAPRAVVGGLLVALGEGLGDTCKMRRSCTALDGTRQPPPRDAQLH